MNLPPFRLLPLLFSSALALTAGGCALPGRPVAASGPAAGQSWAVPLTGPATLPMVWIAPGTFLQGSPANEPGRRPDEGPQTAVTLTRGFWLGRTEVTVAQWQSVMGVDLRGQLARARGDDTLYDLGGKKQTVRAFMRWTPDAPPEQYLANEGDRLPMYFVSWNDAMEFGRRLTEREHAAGRLPAGYCFTLPTEAQWEYACRAGTTGATYAESPGAATGGPVPLDRIAWYNGNSATGYTGRGFGRPSAGPREVGAKLPNAWGLQDMAGNLWEWCRDWYGPYPGGAVTDPTGPAAGTDRVNRGGSFGSGTRDERSANRAKNPPAEASAYRGFRLALCPAP